jgi:hypothetical protein
MDIDECIKNEEREFFYEALLLLERSQNKDVNDGEEEHPDEITDVSSKDIILYAFLALSLVKDAERDVAAVAVYEMKDSVRVFYTKNRLNEGDIAMANQLVDIVRTAARDSTMTASAFHELYFQHLTEKCTSKFLRRFDAMKKDVFKTRKRDDVMPSTAAELEDLLEAYVRSGTKRTVQSRADTVAATFSKDGNIYKGVKKALSAIRKHVLIEQTLHSYIKLAVWSWVVASSSVLNHIVKQAPTYKPLILSMQKYGDYYRGASQLFKTVTQSNTIRIYYSNIHITAIERPPPLPVKFEKDWFHVLQVLYYRARGTQIPIQKGQFMECFGSAVNAYETGDSEKQNFLPHCETTLIRHLTPKPGPTELGVSKACCALCFAYIRGVNKYRKSRGQSQWVVGGSHLKLYLWQCMPETEESLAAGEASVKKLVFDKIVKQIDECTRGITESPPQFWSPEDNEDELDSRYKP